MASEQDLNATLKTWQQQFKAKNGKMPTPQDMQLEPEIQRTFDAYQEIRKKKTPQQNLQHQQQQQPITSPPQTPPQSITTSPQPNTITLSTTSPQSTATTNSVNSPISSPSVNRKKVKVDPNPNSLMNRLGLTSSKPKSPSLSKEKPKSTSTTTSTTTTTTTTNTTNTTTTNATTSGKAMIRSEKIIQEALSPGLKRKLPDSPKPLAEAARPQKRAKFDQAFHESFLGVISDLSEQSTTTNLSLNDEDIEFDENDNPLSLSLKVRPGYGATQYQQNEKEKIQNYSLMSRNVRSLRNLKLPVHRLDQSETNTEKEKASEKIIQNLDNMFSMYEDDSASSTTLQQPQQPQQQQQQTPAQIQTNQMNLIENEQSNQSIESTTKTKDIEMKENDEELTFEGKQNNKKTIKKLNKSTNGKASLKRRRASKDSEDEDDENDLVSESDEISEMDDESDLSESSSQSSRSSRTKRTKSTTTTTSKKSRAKNDEESSSSQTSEPKNTNTTQSIITTTTTSTTSTSENPLAESFKGKRQNFRRMNPHKGHKKGAPSSKYNNTNPNFGKAKQESQIQSQNLEEIRTALTSNTTNVNDQLDDGDFYSELPLILNQSNKKKQEEKKITQPTIVVDKFSEQDILENLKKTFGYDSFSCDEQLQAISRTLNSLSTLVILPTGTGKSVCYQLPITMMKSPSIAIIVTPLLSLAIDQIQNLARSSSLKAVTIDSTQSASLVKMSVESLKNGEARILLISPEKICSRHFLEEIVPSLPPIAYAAIDEAHCISEWSLNFRPSYLKLNRILRNQLGVKSIMALTATATNQVEKDVCSLLSIQSKDGVLRSSSCIRSNLHLSLCDSSLGDKFAKLLNLLKEDAKLIDCKSIIIYCLTQHQTEVASSYLRNNGIQCQSYHAGKPTSERESVQDRFMSGKLKIVAATVAFGMGLNKTDVDCVIHFNLPRSISNFVQEVGRAGRNGKDAYSLVFLDSSDFETLFSLAHADSVDSNKVIQLCRKVFGPKKETTTTSTKEPPISLKTMSVEDSEREFDMKESVLTTILTILESWELVSLLPQLASNCKVRFLKTDPQILASQHKSVKWVLENGSPDQGSYQFDLCRFANVCWEMDSVAARQFWFDLEHKQNEISFSTSGKSFCYVLTAKSTSSNFSVDSTAQKIHEKLQQLEKCRRDATIHTWALFYDCLITYSSLYTEEKKSTLFDSNNKAMENALRSELERYFIEIRDENVGFENNNNNNNEKKKDENGEESKKSTTTSVRTIKSRALEPNPSRISVLKGDIRMFLKENSGNPNLTPRRVARIFHSIDSPVFTSATWHLNKHWGRARDIDFNIVLKAAQEEIVAMRVGKV